MLDYELNEIFMRHVASTLSWHIQFAFNIYLKLPEYMLTLYIYNFECISVYLEVASVNSAS